MILALGLAASLGLAAADELVHRFRISVAGGAITGSEEYRIESADAGYRLTGKLRIDQGGRVMELEQLQTLDADWMVERYRLAATMMGQSQLVEVSREGEQLAMKASMGMDSKSQSVPLTPMSVVLDNLVPSHYQILLNALTGKVEAGADWSLLVPQRLTAIKGKVAFGPLEKGILDGKSAAVRKYTLQAGSLLVEFWADDLTSRLMRIAVPLQKVEIVREGFVPAAEAESAAPASVVERQLTFPSAGLQFPATLALPSGASGKVPLVVLVHGSGPNDRDETIGPNKPFRDLAHGLAEAGIASLRYDKRTFAFRDKIDKKITLDQEVIDDAVAALEFARGLPEARADALFLLGHSMGATAAPIVSRRFPGLRGVVLMAGAARPLDQLIYEQVAFQSRIAGLSRDQVEMKVADLKVAFARVRSGEAGDEEVIMGAPAHYWRDVFGIDVPKALAEMKPPALVLQGGKDIQIGKTDYDLILKSLAARPEAERQAHWLPELNHLFMKVEGESTGAEYARPGRVDAQPIGLIAAWVKRIQ